MFRLMGTLSYLVCVYDKRCHAIFNSLIFHINVATSVNIEQPWMTYTLLYHSMSGYRNRTQRNGQRPGALHALIQGNENALREGLRARRWHCSRIEWNIFSYRWSRTIDYNAVIFILLLLYFIVWMAVVCRSLWWAACRGCSRHAFIPYWVERARERADDTSALTLLVIQNVCLWSILYPKFNELQHPSNYFMHVGKMVLLL